MREITKLTISILYLIFLLSVMCVQGSNVTGTLFQLTSKVTTCADIYARLLTKPLSNPLLGSLYMGTFISLSCQVLVYHVKAAIRNQCFRNSDTFRSLVVFE